MLSHVNRHKAEEQRWRSPPAATGTDRQTDRSRSFAARKKTQPFFQFPETTRRNIFQQLSESYQNPLFFTSLCPPLTAHHLLIIASPARSSLVAINSVPVLRRENTGAKTSSGVFTTNVIAKRAFQPLIKIIPAWQSAVGLSQGLSPSPFGPHERPPSFVTLAQWPGASHRSPTDVLIPRVNTQVLT